MEFLLCWFVNSFGFTVGHRNLPALLELHLLAVRPHLGLAAGGALDLAGEGVRHPRPLVVLRLVVPDLLLVTAVDLGNDELDVLRDEFAFLK